MIKVDLIKKIKVSEFYGRFLMNDLSVACDLEENFFKQFSILAVSTKSFEELEMWDAISKKFDVPLYNLLCCGLYGFYYVSLGSRFTLIK